MTYLWEKQRGQSLLEVIVALAVFSIIAAAMTQLALGGFVGLEQGGEQTEAQALAQEGIEAVRSIRDRAWNEYVYNQSAVSVSGGEWVFDGEGTTEMIGQYLRTISFASVCRDGSDDIAVCPGSYTDLHAKRATVTVDWNTGTGETNQVQRVAYITNWDSREWTQTDWSGGSGQATWSDSTRYDEDDGSVDVGTAGQLQLASAADGTWVQSGGTEITHTADTDFDGGTFTDTEVSGTGSGASIILVQNAQWAEHADSTSVTTKDINDVVVITPSNVWAVGNTGKIFHYDGSNWTETIDMGDKNINAMSAVNASDIWAAGAGGKIYHYDGSSWSEYADTGGETWNDIVMTSASNGWVVGNSGALAQYDGSSWSESTAPSSKNMFSVYAISASNIWAGGKSGRLWNYDGSAWSLHTDTGDEKWYDLVFTSASSGWAVGNNGALARWDGSNWSESSVPSAKDIRGVSAVSASDIWAAGNSGRIWHYDGSSWSLYADTGGQVWNAIAMVSSTSGWIVGNGGNIYEYGIFYASSGTFESEIIDSGGSATVWDTVRWTETLTGGSDITVATRTGDTLIPDGSWSSWGGEKQDAQGESIDSPDARYLQYRVTFTRGDSALQTPSLADVTVIYDSPTSDRLRAVSVVSDSDVWAVGNNGTIIHYDGNSWSAVTSPVSNKLYGVHMRTGSDGWAVGSSGKILHYDGADWSESEDTGGETWRGVVAVEGNDVWVVGQSGKLAQYDGSGWTESDAPVNQDLYSVSAVAADDIWAVGASGKIIHYDGSSWSEDTDIGSQSLNGVYMVSDSDGWAAGASGKIIRFDGSSWAEYVDTGGDTWNAVFFVDSSDGWIVGDNGEIRRWLGSTWDDFTSPTGTNIDGIAMASATGGWAVGKNGIIIRFTREGLYQESGTLTSSAFDMSDVSPVQIIEWDEIIPSAAYDINFKVRTAPDSGGSPGTWTSWYGASGSGTTFDDEAGSLISTDLNGNQWVQYQVTLSGDGDDTPILSEVRVNYK